MKKHYCTPNIGITQINEDVIRTSGKEDDITMDDMYTFGF